MLPPIHVNKINIEEIETTNNFSKILFFDDKYFIEDSKGTNKNRIDKTKAIAPPSLFGMERRIA